MYIQINEKAPIEQQIKQLKTQLEMILDDITVQAETATTDPVAPSGEGLPTGGSTGQLLAKKSATDGDVEWNNGYVHPAAHSPSIITQDADNRFSSDAEKATWNGKAAGTHGHSISDIALLVDALSGKSATGHGHAISDVTDLSTALSGKADTAKGVPTGGTTDQVLAKVNGTDNNLKWSDMDAKKILAKPVNIETFTGMDGYILAYDETNGEFYLKKDEGGGGGDALTILADSNINISGDVFGITATSFAYPT